MEEHKGVEAQSVFLTKMKRVNFYILSKAAMKANKDNNFLINDSDPEETQEWIESIQDMAEDSGGERAKFIISRLVDHVESLGIPAPANITTPFINTIRKEPLREA